MSSIILDTKNIIENEKALREPRDARRALFQNSPNVVGAVQKTKTAASTISTRTPTPNANSWPVTLWK